jgi:hypothetical protein
MATADRTELAGLLCVIDRLEKENAAKGKRIAFLERRLEQRFESTRQDYLSKLKYFESMQQKILQLFLEDVPPSTGLTHWQIREEFERKFPAIQSSNVDRRVQELTKAGKLWAHKDDDGTVRFYLRLEENGKSDRQSPSILRTS